MRHTIARKHAHGKPPHAQGSVSKAESDCRDPVAKRQRVPVSSRTKFGNASAARCMSPL